MINGQERTVYPDHSQANNSRIPWNWVAPLVVTLIFNALTFSRTVTTEKDLDKFKEQVRESYYKPLADKIMPLESYRLEAMRDMSKLQSDVNETKATVGFVKDNMLQGANSSREAIAELKTMIRDLANKLERAQLYSGRPTPQRWVPDDYYAPDMYPTLQRPAMIQVVRQGARGDEENHPANRLTDRRPLANE